MGEYAQQQVSRAKTSLNILYNQVDLSMHWTNAGKTLIFFKKICTLWSKIVNLLLSYKMIVDPYDTHVEIGFRKTRLWNQCHQSACKCISTLPAKLSDTCITTLDIVSSWGHMHHSSFVLMTKTRTSTHGASVRYMTQLAYICTSIVNLRNKKKQIWVLWFSVLTFLPCIVFLEQQGRPATYLVFKFFYLITYPLLFFMY